MRLNEDMEGAELCERLNAALPADIRVLVAREIEDKAPAVQTQVLSADYQVAVRGPVDLVQLSEQVNAMLTAASLPCQRRDRAYDLRPLIERLEAHGVPTGDGAILEMRLKSQEGATGRPDEVLLALEIARERARIERTALHFKADPVPAASLMG